MQYRLVLMAGHKHELIWTVMLGRCGWRHAIHMGLNAEPRTASISHPASDAGQYGSRPGPPSDAESQENNGEP